MAVTCARESGFADLERGGLTRLMTTFEDRTEAFEWLGAAVKEIPGKPR
jgi:hypothetical protein